MNVMSSKTHNARISPTCKTIIQIDCGSGWLDHHGGLTNDWMNEYIDEQKIF